MFDNTGNNQLNINIGSQNTHSVSGKTSVNKYYNIFSKKMEEIELPDIDLEFNTAAVPEKTTFFRAT